MDASVPPAPAPDRGLTIVAIGASAGGLEPLTAFFRAMPEHPQLAFVVVTHLPADHVSHLADVLDRAGALRVSQARDGERVDGGHVYVMPPGALMRFSEGALRLDTRVAGPSAPKPIDHFMTSLADEVGDRSVGIVLSGTNHDGTAGLRAIRQAGGLTLVQRPDTAQFTGMPDSGIAAGVADRVLAPQEMPEVLRGYLAHMPSELVDPATRTGPDDATDAGLKAVLTRLLARTGHDFRWYRSGMLRRRLRHRMGLSGVDRVADYVALLERSRDEVEALKGEFLIGVTDFFRDPEVWQALEDEVVPQLLASRRDDDQPIRVWTPGCATGEESYSIAMLLLEQFDEHDSRPRVQVFGTDIDEDALRVGRRGAYPLAIAATVSAQRLARFFDRHADRYVVRKPLREAVLFAPQSLVRDTPFSKLDLVLCRNLLIYFQPELQQRVLRIFHFAVKPGGFLLLGRAESIDASTALFEPASRRARLFRRIGGRSYLPRQVGQRSDAAAALGVTRRGSPRAPAFAEILRVQLGQREVTAAALLDRDGRALYFHGPVGQFLEPHGEATMELVALVRPELRAVLRNLVRQVLEGGRPHEHRTTLTLPTGRRRVRVTVEPVVDPDERGLMLVLLTAMPTGTADTAPVPASGPATTPPSQQDFDDSRHELMLTLEDAERTNEDLRIANEEAMALNEELQSSNEELESSREELQALNEELATVNAQLEDKVGELARSHDDLTNLLASTDIATVLLDKDLHIRRFTPAAARLFSLQAGDEGRRLTDLSSRLDDPGFFSELRRVAATATPAEAEVATASDQWFLRRILPYRSGESDVQGVVVTFVDITPGRAAALHTRRLVAADRRKDEYLAMLAHELRNPLAPIRNAALLLARTPNADPKAVWATGVIERQVDVMARLLEDLLDVARIASGKVTLALAPVDVAVLVDRAVEISRPLIDARRHRLLVDLSSDPLAVRGDLLRLTQVLANLINNAAKYTDDGGEIRIEARRVDREAVIRVSDTGAGISAEMLPRVFDFFAQADTTLDRSKGGLGLGLTLVRQLVVLHGGTVEAHSDGLGKGSQFVVRLPVLNEPTVPEPTPRAAPPGALAATGRRVLVVDDNIDAAQTLANLLQTYGHEVRAVHDAREVVAVVDQWHPDVAVLDIGLPEIDGYQLARTLRGRSGTAAMVLIALTGYGQPEDAERARAAGFDHHMVKPAAAETLHAWISAPPVAH